MFRLFHKSFIRRGILCTNYYPPGQPLSLPLWQNERVMQIQNLSNDQMELGFNGNNRRAASHHRRQTRLERAAWWFGKMRSVVDNAIAWTPKPTPPPQQMRFAK